MSTAQGGRPEMTVRTIEPAQHTAAKVAGFIYLLTTFISVFGVFYVRGQLIVSGDAVQTARNIAASERLFRIGTVCDVIGFVGVILVVALYVILKTIDRHVALFAAFCRLGECFVIAVITVNDFAALSLLSGADYLRAFDTQQLQALAYTFLRVHTAGYQIGIVFFGVGSTVFAWLWFKSRYIPRGLAALGIFSSLVMAILMLAFMVFPALATVVTPVYYGPPGFIFEVGLGLWLLVKGIQAPIVE